MDSESGGMMRVRAHPILRIPERKTVNFVYNGQHLYGYEGDTIASALHALGIKELSRSIHLHRPRGFFCAIGNCSSCQMTVNNVPNVKTCITRLEEGMVVTTEAGLGKLL